MRHSLIVIYFKFLLAMSNTEVMRIKKIIDQQEKSKKIEEPEKKEGKKMSCFKNLLPLDI